MYRILKIKNNLAVAGRQMLSDQEHYLLFHRTWDLLLVPTYQLRATCGSCSRDLIPSSGLHRCCISRVQT